MLGNIDAAAAVFDAGSGCVVDGGDYGKCPST